MNPFEAVDRQLVKLWHGVIRVLCGLTGRSNFFFARLIIIGAGFWSIRWAAVAPADWVAVSGLAAIGALALWLTILLQRDAADKTTDYPVGAQRFLVAFRSSLNLITAIEGFQSIYNPQIRLMVLIMALLDVLCYSLSILIPPQSSWMRRAGQAARNQVSMSPSARRR